MSSANIPFKAEVGLDESTPRILSTSKAIVGANGALLTVTVASPGSRSPSRSRSLSVASDSRQQTIASTEIPNGCSSMWLVPTVRGSLLLGAQTSNGWRDTPIGSSTRVLNARMRSCYTLTKMATKTQNFSSTRLFYTMRIRQRLTHRSLSNKKYSPQSTRRL